MARLNLVEKKVLRKKKLLALYMYWFQLMHVAQWFYNLICNFTISRARQQSLRGQKYFLDFHNNRIVINRLVYDNDITCIEQLRMNRHTFSTLCRKLELEGGLKPSKYLLVDEQVAMFLHIVAHHVKNRVIKFRFMRSGETVSRYFHKVLHAILRLQCDLLKKHEPVPENSTDERWKWFKVNIFFTFF